LFPTGKEIVMGDEFIEGLRAARLELQEALVRELGDEYERLPHDTIMRAVRKF
jgi:hypothetical protein